MIVYTLFLIACFATGVLSSAPCKLTDKECIAVKVRDAIPGLLLANASLGIESSDPLFVEQIEVDLPLTKYVFYNSTVLGYNNCRLSDIRLLTDVLVLHYLLRCNKLNMSGKIGFSSHLEALPVAGEGDYSLVSGEYELTVDVSLSKYVGSDGNNHIGIGEFKLKSKVLSAPKLLSNGQKHLADAQLFQDTIWHGTLKKVLSNFNKYLEHIPFERIFSV